MAWLQSGWLFIRGDEGTDGTFFMLLASIAVLGASGGVTDSAFSGLAAFLPFEYYQAFIYKHASSFLWTMM